VFFLPRDVMRKRGLCCCLVSVRPSVRHVGAFYPHGWSYHQTSLSAGSPIIQVFFDPKRRYQIPRETPSAVAQNTRGWEIWRFSTEIAVCLGNGTR